MNNANQKTPTPAQALNILVMLSQHPSLAMCLGDHTTAQTALQVLREVVQRSEAKPEPEVVDAEVIPMPTKE